ncbi:LOW QUALITY PROTEIN: hypothetical protein Cgig2_029575 [Carnegiea gigantea]|uniref:Zinc finger PMZ-type domain-containing protein n=1 Tax=Carnegiea gigantea TaxID=171969 RepID=A0A9Q1JML7_9CARY|nr:LOW QUALITY PROTEIN: hypothetical protein Cgig2_029575 [Carnegiea gigantea]
MGLEEVRRKVSEITDNELIVRKLYLKYDRDMVMELEGGGDVRMFLKGNDEHGYLYVGKSDGPKRHTQKAMRTCDDGVVHVRSGRDRDDMDQQDRNRAGVKGATVSGSGGCNDDYPQIRLRVGREIIEMSDDDEISVASEDVGEDEAAVEGGEESSKAWEEDGQAQAGHDEVEEWRGGENRAKDGLYCNGGVLQFDIRGMQCGAYQQSQTCTYRVWQTRGIPCYHALAVIAKANLWVYDYVHPIYKTATQQIIYNQLVHPMETHDMGIVDAKTGRVVVRHTRHTCRNPRVDFDANYEGNIMEVEDLLDGNLKCLPNRRPVFTMVNHSLQSSCHFDILIILDSQLPPHPHPCLDFNVQGAGMFTPVCTLMIEYVFALYSAMFTQPEAYVHHGKPWCASGTLPCLPSMRPMLTMVNHGVQVATDRFKLCSFGILLILPRQLSPHPTPLTEELREVQELVCAKQNDHHFIQKEDRAVDSKCNQTRHDKAIIIRRLQASVNKLKATLLEKGHTVRASEGTNMKLAVAVEVLYGSPKNVRQALVPQGPDVALVEVHRAASQCENIHEDHHKNAVVMAIAKPLSFFEC